MYSLSTCWNSHRHTDGRLMLREIRSLGFDYAELSHGIRISLLPGIFEAVDAGEIRISSLHNFCPLPMGVDRAAPNIFKFTSEDPREREMAYRQTLKTFETAVRVKAPLVVLHMGKVDMKDYTDRLLEMAGAGQRETPKYEKLCAEVLEKREKRKEPHLTAAYELLRRLIREAEARGLRLGIENREALEEIPFETDFPLFFREFDRPSVVYWHDTGHAQIKENLGFIHHGLHLEALADRLAGFHIHDVSFPGRDHLPPGAGGIDFAALAGLVKPEHIKVLELGPWVPTADVQRGWEHIRSLWGET
ncbi:sugar phosphate isomerase/epimerase [Fontisphaera persica]|uniref:sugar phosphate isomerase/epimerase family protein n=1 Tax=Fontisphaera persica TaxID=2974023 RepID=UPI0024C078C6|nr:sugar phosphate isomerase/epimerase [Fontisphaera persica]WCJ58152.1 sugar phosphate isomerase/epimerase [Fontisphaera persica]